MTNYYSQSIASLETYFSYKPLMVSCKIKDVHLFFISARSIDTLLLKFGVDFTVFFSVNDPDAALSISVPTIFLKQSFTIFCVEKKISYFDIAMDVVITISKSFAI